MSERLDITYLHHIPSCLVRCIGLELPLCRDTQLGAYFANLTRRRSWRGKRRVQLFNTLCISEFGGFVWWAQKNQNHCPSALVVGEGLFCQDVFYSDCRKLFSLSLLSSVQLCRLELDIHYRVTRIFQNAENKHRSR